jgi:hypothetical protein
MMDTHLINMAMANLGMAVGAAVLLAISIIAVAMISKSLHVARPSQFSGPLTGSHEESPAGVPPTAQVHEPRDLVLR